MENYRAYWEQSFDNLDALPGKSNQRRRNVAEGNKTPYTADAIDLVIEWVFDAPRRARVESMDRSRADETVVGSPQGFTVPVSDGELRPGGSWRAVMVKPDGTELKLGGEYREIVEPERLVFTHAWYDEEGVPGPETLVTVLLEERGDKTAMTFRQTGFASAGSPETGTKGVGVRLRQLASLLSGA